jgi:hypothetical protein
MYNYARSVEYQVELFRKYYGPTVILFNNVPENQQEKLRGEMIDLLQQYNVADDDTLVLKIDYQQTIAVKK